jgi:hypothetical protein
VDFSEARDLFGIIFQFWGPNYKIRDCGLILKKLRGLSAKCKKLEFPGIVFLKENPWTKSTSSWTAPGWPVHGSTVDSTVADGRGSYDSVLSRFEHDKPHHLMDSNRLHHSKPCSNHNIEPRHSHLTSRRMKDQHSQYSRSQTQQHKDGKTCKTLKTAWLSITNQA